MTGKTSPKVHTEVVASPTATRTLRARDSFFVRPPSDAYDVLDGRDYFKGFKTYSQYNFLRPGFIPWLKTRRFELALRLAHDKFGQGNAIDFGCADGILLPSLARRFGHVVGIDISSTFIAQAQALVNHLGLENVALICNQGMGIEQIRDALAGREYGAMFLLETLEHMGERDRPYESRIAVVHDLLSLLADGGIIVLSVPRMVGWPFFARHVIQRVLGMHYEPVTFRQLWRASVLRSTDELEPLWTRYHIGFNELKLDEHLRRSFRIETKRRTLANVFYVLGRERASQRPDA